MHPLLRIAVAVQLLSTAIFAALTSFEIEELFPDGAIGEVFITDDVPHPSPPAVIRGVADRSGVTVVRLDFEDVEGLPHRRIQTLPVTQEHASDSDRSGRTSAADRDWLNGGAQYGQFGPLLTSSVEKLDQDDSVIGRWVAYGSAADYEEFLVRLDDARFTFEHLSTINDFSHFISIYNKTAPAIIQLSMASILFVAATLSASRETRVRNAKLIHGIHPARAAAHEILRYTAFTAATSATIIILWWAVASASWGNSQLFTGAGRSLMYMMALQTAVTSAILTLATLLVAFGAGGLVAQLRGVRPHRTMQVLSALACCVALMSAITAIDNERNVSSRVDAARHSLSVWEDDTSHQAIFIQYVSEQVVTDHTFEWSAFADALASDGRLLLNLPDPACLASPDGTFGDPCLLVNRKYLEWTEVKSASGERVRPDQLEADQITILIPEDSTFTREAIISEIEDFALFQVSMPAETGACGPDTGTDCPPRTELPPITVVPTAADQDLPVYRGSPQTAENSTIFSPIVVVLPDTGPVTSADLHLAATSSGHEIFEIDREGLDQMIEQFGIDPLIHSIGTPAETARSELARTTLHVAQAMLVLSVALLNVTVLVMIGGMLYCERRRRPLFVSYLHGRSPWSRYGPHLLSFIAIAILSAFMSTAMGIPWSFGRAIAFAGVVGALFTLLLPVLFVNDRRFRSDYLKRP